MSLKYVLACLFCIPTLASATIISTFDTSNEGWTLRGDPSPPTHQAGGGNPGGYIAADDTAGVNYFTFLIAPSAFTGDFSSYIGGSFSFDARLDFSSGGPLEHTFGWVYLTGGGTTVASRLGDDNLPSDWTTYSSSLVASNWMLADLVNVIPEVPEGSTTGLVNEATFAAVLSDITEIRISGEPIGGSNEITGFDNIGIHSTTTSPIPLPSAIILMGTGLLGLLGLGRRRV